MTEEERRIKREQKRLAEIERTHLMYTYEREASAGALFIAGVDEVGRGPLAGPVVAGAVILPADHEILGLNDSKKLSEKRRTEMDRIIREQAVAIGLGVVSQERIDEINILQATYEAMRLAIADLATEPDLLLVDAVTIPDIAIRQNPIVKGDAKSASIAAASIVAKVFRDNLMVEYDAQFPGYDLASNKGYGTKKHIEAIRSLGPTPLHRRSFIGKFISGDHHGE